MPELSDLLKEKTYYRKKIIHDCVSDGTDDQTLLAGVGQDFTCNCDGYQYNSDSSITLWDGDTLKNGIQDTSIAVKLGFSLTGSPNDEYEIQIYIPHPDGDILVEDFKDVLTSQTNGLKQSKPTWVYVGAEALEYGFKFRFISDATMTLSDKSIGAVE